MFTLDSFVFVLLHKYCTLYLIVLMLQTFYKILIWLGNIGYKHVEIFTLVIKVI